MTTETIETPAAKKRAAAAPKEAAGPIQITRIKRTIALVPVRGTAPLVVHAWSQKAKQAMLDAAQQKKKAREPKNPEQEYLDALYTTANGRYGVPTLGFKASVVGAARFFTGLTMVQARMAMFFHGDDMSTGTGEVMLNLIHSDSEPTMREDTVRVGQGGTDLRYRPQFPAGWTTTLRIEFVESVISLDSILALVDAGGFGIGICEWRPERAGMFGTYEIDPTKEIAVNTR